MQLLTDASSVGDGFADAIVFFGVWVEAEWSEGGDIDAAVFVEDGFVNADVHDFTDEDVAVFVVTNEFAVEGVGKFIDEWCAG